MKSAPQLMATRKLSAPEAQDVLRRVREQIWILPGFQEQLVIWGICQYNVTPENGIYKNWRIMLNNNLNHA